MAFPIPALDQLAHAAPGAELLAVGLAEGFSQVLLDTRDIRFDGVFHCFDFVFVGWVAETEIALVGEDDTQALRLAFGAVERGGEGAAIEDAVVVRRVASAAGLRIGL